MRSAAAMGGSDDSFRTGCRSACRFDHIKTFLIVVNLIFVLLGWSLVAFGAWMHISQESFYFNPLLYDTDNRAAFAHDSIPVLLIVIGTLLSVISFIGCCGVYAESACFLGFYLVLLILIVLTQVIIVTLAASIKEQSLRRLMLNMQHQIRYDYNRTATATNIPPHYHGSEDESSDREHENCYNVLTATWNTLQRQLECCGALSPQDYIHSSWFNHTKAQTGLFIPQSCCVPVDERRDSEPRDESLCQTEGIIVNSGTRQPITQLYVQGCYTATVNWVQKYERLAIAILVVTLVLQLIDILVVLVFMRLIHIKLSYYYTYNDNDELYNGEQREEESNDLDILHPPLKGNDHHTPPPPNDDDDLPGEGGDEVGREDESGENEEDAEEEEGARDGEGEEEEDENEEEVEEEGEEEDEEHIGEVNDTGDKVDNQEVDDEVDEGEEEGEEGEEDDVVGDLRPNRLKQEKLKQSALT